MMDNGFVKYCLVPWCEQFEQECDVKLLTQSEKVTGNIFTRFNLSGLLRGDTKSRSEFYDTMLKNMVFTINDVRRLEGLNDVEWGYEPYAQSGVAQVDADGTVGAPINQAEQVTDQTQQET
jgi:phage portal protein BeeE